MKKFTEAIVNDEEYAPGHQRLLSLVFLAIADLLAFNSYTSTGFFWDSTFNLQPGAFETFIAIAMVAPLYLRGILSWKKSTYSILFFVLVTWLFGSLASLATGGKDHNVVTYLLIGTVALSWLGIREVAGVGWVLLLLIGGYGFLKRSADMDIFGFVYVVSGFLGLVVHGNLNPGQLLRGLKAEYSQGSYDASRSAKEDIQAAIRRAK